MSHRIKYLEKLLAIKAVWLQDQTQIISPDLLQYTKYSHKSFDNHWIVYVEVLLPEHEGRWIFNVAIENTSVTLSREDDWVTYPHPIILTRNKSFNPDHYSYGQIPFDITLSQYFIPFKPILDADEEHVVKNNFKGYKMASMSSMDLPYKIAFIEGLRFEIMRFYSKHSDVGLEFCDRQINQVNIQ